MKRQTYLTVAASVGILLCIAALYFMKPEPTSVRQIAVKEGYFIREFPGNKHGFYISKHQLPKENFVMNKNKIDSAWDGIVWVNAIDGTFIIDQSAKVWDNVFAIGDPVILEDLDRKMR